MSRWQVQEAAAHLAEVVDKAGSEGVQTLTQDGAETAVVLSIEEYRLLSSRPMTLIEHLLSGPKFDDFELPPRQIDPPRDLNLWDDEDGDEQRS